MSLVRIIQKIQPDETYSLGAHRTLEAILVSGPEWEDSATTNPLFQSYKKFHKKKRRPFIHIRQRGY